MKVSHLVIKNTKKGDYLHIKSRHIEPIKEVYYFEPLEDYTLVNEKRHGTLAVNDRPSIRELMLISPSIPDGHEYIHTNKGITTGLINKVD